MTSTAPFSRSLWQAFDWLESQRLTRARSACDLWALRQRWQDTHRGINDAFENHTLTLSAQRRHIARDGEGVDLWETRDTLILKALSLTLEPLLPRHETCAHLKGHGRLKGAIRAGVATLTPGSHVLRTDVKSYYASIDHQKLLDRLAAAPGHRHAQSHPGHARSRKTSRQNLDWPCGGWVRVSRLYPLARSHPRLGQDACPP